MALVDLVDLLVTLVMVDSGSSGSSSAKPLNFPNPLAKRYYAHHGYHEYYREYHREYHLGWSIMGVDGEGGEEDGEPVVESGEGGGRGSVEKYYSVNKQDKMFALMPEKPKIQAFTGMGSAGDKGGGGGSSNPHVRLS